MGIVASQTKTPRKRLVPLFLLSLGQHFLVAGKAELLGRSGQLVLVLAGMGIVA
jgi:hypothetical protein